MKQLFKLQNLKCQGCESTIINQLLTIDGIKNIALDIPKSELILIVQDESVLEKTKKKLSKMGYPVEGDKNNLIKKATSYVSCAVGKLSN